MKFGGRRTKTDGGGDALRLRKNRLRRNTAVEGGRNYQSGYLKRLRRFGGQRRETDGGGDARGLRRNIYGRQTVAEDGKNGQSGNMKRFQKVRRSVSENWRRRGPKGAQKKYI